ncbi:MAG: GNAT family N-acetyltransferase [Gemmatimonadota bacterium]
MTGTEAGAGPPVLHTERLALRPFTAEDANDVRRLAGDREIAGGTLTIPHPYGPGVAEAWIATHPEAYLRGEQVVFAVERRGDGALVGSVGLDIAPQHRSAELGYWIGRPYWGSGFGTEAAARVLAFGFADLALNRISARCFARNPASGRVLEKLGMRHEGCGRGEILKWGVFEDIHHYAMLKAEFEAALAAGAGSR